MKRRVNQKNEILNEDVYLTNRYSNKTDAGEILMQEGHIKEKPKLDIKGISIKKVTVPKYIREYFTDLIKQDILACPKISMSNIVGKYQKLEDIIRESIEDGSTEFIKPGKINQISSYQFPYRIPEVRGVMLWNAMYPENEITIPNKVNLVKTNLLTIDDIREANIPDEIKEKLLMELLVEDEELAKYGMSVIALPKNMERIPDWIVPYLNVSSHVIDNMKPGKIMLDSLGFKDITVGANQIATNIIDI